MSLWQIIDTNNEPEIILFDDGIENRPGEIGFNTDAVVALGKPFNYVGVTPKTLANDGQ